MPEYHSTEDLLNNGKSTGEGGKVTIVYDVGSMSNRAAVSVTTTAAEITIGTGKETIEIQNTGSDIVYLGGSGVTSSNYGTKLFPNQIKTFRKVKPTFSFYHICAATESSTLSVAEYS